MRIKVTMKCPDALEDATNSAINDYLEQSNVPEEDREEEADLRRNEASILAKKWFSHGEYLTVVLDTEAQTCTVQSVKVDKPTATLTNEAVHAAALALYEQYKHERWWNCAGAGKDAIYLYHLPDFPVPAIAEFHGIPVICKPLQRIVIGAHSG